MRFLALYFNSNIYEKPLNEFLNKFSESHRSADVNQLNIYRGLFTNAIDFIYRTIGRKAFRLARPLNAAVFDSIMVGLAKRLDDSPDINEQQFVSAYHELLNDPEYITLITGSTSDETNVASRLERATKKFAET